MQKHTFCRLICRVLLNVCLLYLYISKPFSFASAIKTNVICFVLLSVCINFAGEKRK